MPEKEDLVHLVSNYLPQTADSFSNDRFLSSVGVELMDQSSFLSNHYLYEQLGLADSYNPRDPFGVRLNSLWKANDTIMSVGLKRSLQIIDGYFNPDTYTRKQLEQLKEEISTNKIHIYGAVGVCLLPYIFYIALLKPRIARISREYLMQYYTKTHAIAKALGKTTTQVPLAKIKQQLAKKQTRTKL